MMPYTTELFFSLIFLFFGITFLESGIDKLRNPDGNLSWFREHFANSIFKKITTPLFWIVTFQELAVGMIMIISICLTIISEDKNMGHLGLLWSLFLLIQLYAGQRIAKDYGGASGIVPYIIVAIIGFFLYGFSI